MTNKRARYGIDYDGTIADTNQVKVIWIREKKGIIIPSWQTDRTTCLRRRLLTKEEYEEMSNAVYEKRLTAIAPEVNDALFSLKQLASNGEVYIVTARSNERIEFVREWLRKKGVIEYITGFETTEAEHMRRSKEKICEDINLDVLIDDDERHISQIQLQGLKRILFKNGCNEDIQVAEGISYARNWREVLNILRLDQPYIY